MMIHQKRLTSLLSCDPRACLATGAMGKPQTANRVPIVKHENQPPPFPHPHPPASSFLRANTLPFSPSSPAFALDAGELLARERERHRRERLEEDVGSMMMYQTDFGRIYHATHVPVCALHGMGKPQTPKIVPIVKHENQPLLFPPFAAFHKRFHFSPFSPTPLHSLSQPDVALLHKISVAKKANAPSSE